MAKDVTKQIIKRIVCSFSIENSPRFITVDFSSFNKKVNEEFLISKANNNP